MGRTDMLVVSAHAADYCTRAGGTIARYVKNGWTVRVIALTYGARGESGSYWRKTTGGTVEECSEIRRRESQAAAGCLGAGIEFYGYDDYPLTMDAERTRLLTRRILDIRPEVILTHWTGDPLNPDHAETGRAVVRAVGSAAQIGAFPDTPEHYFPNLYFFESTVPHSEFNGFCPDTYIEIDEVYEHKQRAIAQFACQPQLGGYYSHFAAHRGFQAKDWAKRDIRYAEGFKRYLPYVGAAFPLTERR